MIEEMFSRLNEAVPLSAPEKRNAMGGPLPAIIRSLSQHHFFTHRIPFSNKRFRHLDLSAKILLMEEKDTFVETKRIHLDALVHLFRHGKMSERAIELDHKSNELLNLMDGIFIDSDPLLKSVGMIGLYFHLYRIARNCAWSKLPDRNLLLAFKESIETNKTIAAEDLARADYRLIQFDKLNQSPNDAMANLYRVVTLINFIYPRLAIAEPKFDSDLDQLVQELVKNVTTEPSPS
jgi:hypothetical protein